MPARGCSFVGCWSDKQCVVTAKFDVGFLGFESQRTKFDHQFNIYKIHIMIISITAEGVFEVILPQIL